MKRGLRHFGLVTLTLLTGGCLVIPYPVLEKDEFAERHLAFVEPGKTQRAQIEEAFGPPLLERRNRQVVIYAQARTIAGAIIAVGGGYMAHVGATSFESYASLIIQFDETGTVTRYDVIRGADECTEDELCIEAEFYGSVSDLSNAVLFTAADEHAVAREFRSDTERCIGYLYNTGTEAIVKAYTASGGTIRLHNRGYARAAASPGDIELHAATAGVSATKKLECHAGDLLFINVKLGKPPGIWSSATEQTLDITLDEPGAGKAIVSERMLIIE